MCLYTILYNPPAHGRGQYQPSELVKLCIKLLFTFISPPRGGGESRNENNIFHFISLLNLSAGRSLNSRRLHVPLTSAAFCDSQVRGFRVSSRYACTTHVPLTVGATRSREACTRERGSRCQTSSYSNGFTLWEYAIPRDSIGALAVGVNPRRASATLDGRFDA